MTGTELSERIRPVEHRLENGLRVLVRVARAAPVAAIVTRVGAGYFDEPDEWVGISHVLEHMFFKGTERRGVGDIARATKAAGGLLNAGTIYDRTTYYTVLPAAAVDTGLDIQADALLHSRIDEAELRSELGVILEEVNRKLDNPSALATEKLYEAMFDVHPMRRWRMGTAATLTALTRDDVLAYYRDRYRAGNVVLVVAGDVDPGHVIERVEALYGSMAPGGPAPTRRFEPDRTGSRFREMSGDIGQTHVELGWRTPGILDDDTPALDVLAAVLGQGRASRLYRGVREPGLASAIGVANYTPTELGVFGAGLECPPDRAREALAAAWAELARIREAAPEAHELDRVRTMMEARLLRRLETAEGQANLLAEWHALGDWRLVGEYLDRVRDLGPDDLRAAAERYLRPERATALVYRPERAQPFGWADDELEVALERRRRSPVDPAVPTRRPAQRGPGPSVTPVRLQDGVAQYEVGGGRVVVMRRPHAPLVTVLVCRSGGVLQEAPATAGATALLMRSSLKGTPTRSAAQIAAESERLGGSISASAGADFVSWSLTLPAARFDEGWSLLADVALRPAFPDDEVEKERTLLLANLERLRDDMYRYPLRLLLGAAFRDHPYGLSVEQVERGVTGLDGGGLRRWHGERLDTPWVFVVGDVEPDAAAGAVAETLRDAPPSPSPDGTVPPGWPAGGGRAEVRRDRAQTAMALGFPGPPRRHPDRLRLEVLSSAVSGLGNRLFEELRSRRSLAYTVATYPLARRQAGVFVGYIATSPDRAADARAGLLEEVARLGSEPPSEEELERARRYMIGSRQVHTQTNAARASELAGALLVGDGLDEIRSFETRVRATTRDDLAAAAARWLDPSRVVEGVVRGG